MRKGTYAVCGSGPLHVRGMREAHDVDLIVSQEVYESYKAAGWKETLYPGDPGRPRALSFGDFDMGTTWSVGSYNPNPQKLIDDADDIDGVAFVKLSEVLEWKTAAKRPKDLADISLIIDYVSSH